MIRLGAILAWMVMAVLFSFAAWQVVQATEDQTTESPSAPVVISGFASPITTGAAPDQSTTSVSSTTPTSTTIPVTTTVPPSTTNPGPATTSSLGSNGTATTAPAPTTTTGPSLDVRVIETKAGTVSVAYAPGEVHFQGASPNVGWKVEVENAGPHEVEVKFERDDRDLEVKVDWDDGELQVEIDEEDDD